MFCPSCGNESTPTSITCTFCSSLIVLNDFPPMEFCIVRPLRTRMVGGVCAGIGIHYGWDIYHVRLALAIAACISTGAIIPFYLMAWKMLPCASFALPPATHSITIRPIHPKAA